MKLVFSIPILIVLLANIDILRLLMCVSSVSPMKLLITDESFLWVRSVFSLLHTHNETVHMSELSDHFYMYIM